MPAENLKEASDNDKIRAEHMLGLMQDLYAIERKAREEDMSYEERYALRQEESLTILKEMENWMKENIIQVLPKVLSGKPLLIP